MLKYLLTQFKNKKAARLEPVLRYMLKQGFIFIHINKTGGTSISSAMGLPYKRHLTAKETIAAIGKNKWNKSYKFSVVRNPWSKVVSHYKYRVRTNQTNMAETKISFKDWLACTYGPDKDPFYYDQPKMFQAQHQWLRDDEGALAMDKIIRFEELEKGFATLILDLGFPKLKLPHLNKTEKVDYKAFYDADTIQTVADWFKEDIELFSYSF